MPEKESESSKTVIDAKTAKLLKNSIRIVKESRELIGKLEEDIQKQKKLLAQQQRELDKFLTQLGIEKEN